jgi:signal transduction histidine kinase
LAITDSHLEQFLSAGRPTAPRRSRCDLGQIVRDVASLVRPASEHRGVSLTLCGTPEEPLELWADAEQLRQLLLNLAVNAVEAAGHGGWVRIELAADRDAVRLRVVDSGPGPPAALVDRLFEPFATGKPEGIGLGLTVAKLIAEAHGGSLEHRQQRPTCFELVLPPHAQRAEATQSAHAGAGGAATHGIVNDHFA